ncbi:MAG: hypothetical protein HY001_05045 [Candidatus Portnoybacteria bacterium]|nr:hypothetical protein [Candidatus Portnoybacteria bacterium]
MGRSKLLTVLITLTALGMLYFAFLDDLKASYQSFGSWLSKKQDIAALEKLIQDAPTLSEKFTKITSEASPLFEALPSTFHESDLIASVAPLASQSGLILSQVEIQKPDLEGNVLLALTLSGNVSSLERFLAAASRTLPFLDVHSFGLEGSKGLQNFNVIFQTYVLPETSRASIPFTQLSQEIERSLSMPLDILKDTRLAKFKPAATLPLPLPPAESVGKSDPFAPL